MVRKDSMMEKSFGIIKDVPRYIVLDNAILLYSHLLSSIKTGYNINISGLKKVLRSFCQLLR